MNYQKWLAKPNFYLFAGIIFMISVILIARTNQFYLCYFPLIFAAIFTSANSVPEKGILFPLKKIRLLGFLTGMVITELIFSIILIWQNELTFRLNSFQTEWVIVAIELLLGIIVFSMFFGISTGFRYLIPRIVNNRKQ
ncbi:MAG TPA: hypothetical protein DHV48_12965 [Prolixibacteraceae bacterium]|nr:hypothetical protein [Prolixibacteraceae bacterium]